MSKIANLDINTPVVLIPVRIAKPWGQEIWHTGMEARGESEVGTNVGQIPLSQYLRALGLADENSANVLLLKVLDPKPTPIQGDLYFEVHEEKQEVYIVTHIDRTVWPDGEGQMRFGMNQQIRKQYANDDAFRAAYLQAVARYERLRRDIDERDIAVAPDAEAQARSHMESFTAQRTLRLGDVVRVPTWTPHSLQHGIRVVEFQTQTYERYIISFAQQVLTQGHWDTAHAIENMHLDLPSSEQFETIKPGVERVVRFDDFNVWRVDLNTAKELGLSAELPYAICMSIDGACQVGDLTLQAEQACFIPKPALAATAFTGNARLLIAAPGL